MMPWHLSDRADPRAARLADRHYNRQRVGSPQFVPPGRCLVLLTARADALWVTSWPFAEYVRHRWGGAWVCSCFRNESTALSSDLIRAACAATSATYGPPPRVATWAVVRREPRVTWIERIEVAMVSFVDRAHVRRKRDPGRCYLRAGWRDIGETRGGLVALGLPSDAVPAAREAVGVSLSLFA